MGRIKEIKATLLALSVWTLLTGVSSAERTPQFEQLSQWYQSNYPFVGSADTICTFETEFNLPPAYQRIDSLRMNPFANWVARLPLWHQWKPVGNAYGRKVLEADQIARAVHLPWKGQYFTDYAIPFRILAEFLYHQKREMDFTFIPAKGDPITYKDWLVGRPAFLADHTMIIKPGPSRDSSVSEFFQFAAFCMQNTDYVNLMLNCDSVADDALIPGDVLIAHNKHDNTGRVFIVLNLIVNSNGDKLYAVGTGCPDACDFHVPVVNDDRNDPWMTVQQIRNLAEGMPETGFYRLKTVTLYK